MKYPFLTLILLVQASFALGQDKINYGARILNEEGSTIIRNDPYEISYVHEVERTLEILSESGLKYANVIISTFPNQYQEEVFQIEGIVANGTEVNKLSKENIFKTKVSDYYTEVKLVLPGVRVGSQIKYSYKIQSKNVVQPRGWEFQHEIPCDKSKFTFSVPPNTTYAFLSNDIEAIKIDSKKKSISSSKSGSSFRMENTFEMSDIPPLTLEPYVSSLENYRYSVRFQLDQIRVNNLLQKIIPTWDKLAIEIKDNSRMGGQYLRKTNHRNFLQSIEPILESNYSKLDKIDSVYSLILNQVRWDGNIRCQTYADESLDEAFQNGTANSGTLNMLMMVALKEMDVEWYPIMASTSDNRNITPQYPIFDQFNHLLSIVNIDGKKLYLDLYSKYSQPGDIRPSLVNTLGWISDKKEPEFIRFEASKSALYSLQEISFRLPDTIINSTQFKAQGYKAVDILKDMEETDCNDLLTRTMKLNSDNLIDLSTECIPSKNSKNISLKILGDIVTSTNINSTIENYYFVPSWVSEKTVQPFKLLNRTYPVEFEYLENETNRIIIQIPEGYSVEEFPQSEKLSMPDDLSTFSFTSVLHDDRIELTYNFVGKSTFIPVGYYPAIRTFYEHIEKKLNEPIYFKKM